MPVGEDSPISQSNQEKLDTIMENLKLKAELEIPEFNLMINALQDNNINSLANTMNSLEKPMKDGVKKLVNSNGVIKETVGDVLAAAGLKYFDSNLDTPYIKTMNGFYADVASGFFQTDAFKDSPEINTMGQLHTIATEMDKCFGDCLKKTFDIDVEPSQIKFETKDELSGGYKYRDNALLLKWVYGDSDEMLDTVFHELTHKVQYAFVNNSTSPKLADYKKHIDMLKYNLLAYYGEPDYRYAYQPLELEAIRNGNTFQKLYTLVQDNEDFDKNDIKANFLKLQKEINDEGNYLNGNSSDSEFDSDSDSDFDSKKKVN